MDAVLMPADELEGRLMMYFRGWLSESSARIAVESIIRVAEQKDSRMSPLSELAADLKKFEDRGRPSRQVLLAKDATEMWDLNGAPGVCVLGDLVIRSQEMASQAGVSMIGLRNSAGVHELSQYVEKLAEDGYVSLFFWNGGSFTTVPYGSSEPFFGTNPIGFGIPTLSRPIVADFATSQIPFRNLMIAFNAGGEVPPGSGMDNSGLETSDPKKIYDSAGDDMVRLRPMGGGPKGSAIMLLAEVLSGALVGGVMAREATDDPFTPEEFAGLLISIDVRAFGFGDDFRSKVDGMATQIRNSRPAPGFEKVVLPGDLANERSVRAGGMLNVPSDLLDIISV